jgi:YtkA-like
MRWLAYRRGTPEIDRWQYNRSVKLLLAILFVAGLVLAQDPPANFRIRFEPTAKLQTGVQVPFEINILDAHDQPVREAKVLLICTQSENDPGISAEGKAVSPGVYIAKPVFPKTGTWNVQVRARREGRESNRVAQFNIAE